MVAFPYSTQQCDGRRKEFLYRIFLCNPAHAQDKPVIVGNNPQLQKQGVKPSYCMVNGGYLGKEKGQLHRFFSLKEVKIQYSTPLHLEVADCLLTETRLKRSVNVTPEQAQDISLMTDAGSMTFDLEVENLFPTTSVTVQASFSETSMHSRCSGMPRV